MKICFLGAGSFGKALAKIAEYNGHEVNFYDPIVFPEIELSTATKGKDLLVYVAPSNKWQDVVPKLPTDTPIICASKGFLSNQPFERIQKEFSAIGGAAFSEDLADENKPVRLTASSEIAENVFSTEHITIEYTKDTLGIMLCGALKNVYAIGAGAYKENLISEEDGCGPQPENVDDMSLILPYLETAASEMQKILEENGADKNTLKLSCGVPDLVLSCTDNSRNFRFGRAIVRNEKPETTTIEGLNVIEELDKYPEFKIPESATLLKDIISRVKNAIK